VRAFDIAVLGLGEGSNAGRRGVGWARVMVGAFGAAGGAAGLAGFVPDAAATTLAIMRRIGAIAIEEGELLTAEETRRACLEVFALRSGATVEGLEGGYFATRLLLQGGPMVRVLSEAAARYGLQLGQKIAGQIVPVVGAVCGAAINVTFMSEYETIARAHFTIRRLERAYGIEAVRTGAVT